MQIQLTPQFEELIERKVQSGRYTDASEVVQEALRLLDERDKMTRLREALAVGEAQVARGEVKPWTSESMGRLLHEAEEDERQGLPIRDEVQP
jgi:antitoxin ParD1/3/4